MSGMTPPDKPGNPSDEEIDRLSRGGVEPPFDSWDVESAWQRASARMDAEGKTPPRVLKLEPARRRVRVPVVQTALRAASILLVAGAAAAGVYVFSRPDTPRVAAVIPAKEYATVRGQRATIQLVDGSRVILGPASKLTVPADYGRAAGDTQPFTSTSSAGPRVLTLAGEGYFDVAHDAARPFAVQTASGMVRDIGTKFVVRAYERGHTLDVAVTEGAVLLSDARLNRGDLGRVDSAGVLRVRRGVDLRPYTSWTEGRLVFNNTPLAEALPTLERWYDLEVSVADSALYQRRLFATVTDGDSPMKVLDLVAISLDLRVERVGRQIILHTRRK